MAAAGPRMFVLDTDCYVFSFDVVAPYPTAAAEQALATAPCL